MWFRVKAEWRWHVRDLSKVEGDLLLPTGCNRIFGSNRVAQTQDEAPPLGDRCRTCDIWYSTLTCLIELEDGAATSQREEE